jgi:2-keto-3-deoxy-L-rhamnonate aldolase RhmA
MILQSGQPQLGMCIMYPAPGIVERIGPDWDWVWIDGQHGELGYSDLLGIVRACDVAQKPGFVRVPWHETGSIGLALDMGAAGVIVPCVDTPEEAQAAVNAAKFPPLGKRSYGGRRPIDRASRLYADTANEDTLLVVQLETPEGIDHAERIAALPGIDALFLGPDDIMLRRGFAMNSPRNQETLGNDMAAVIGACRKHGKFGVMVGAGVELFKLCLAYGYHMIVGGGDVVFLANGSRQTSAELRALVKNAPMATASAIPPVSSPY